MVVGVCYRYGNTLRFPRAASEPPRARPCGVSLRPLLPQESTCISSAGIAFTTISYNSTSSITSLVRVSGGWWLLRE